jgi:hypothetical protein
MPDRNVKDSEYKRVIDEARDDRIKELPTRSAQNRLR